MVPWSERLLPGARRRGSRPPRRVPRVRTARRHHRAWALCAPQATPEGTLILMRAKLPPKVVYVVVDFSDVFSHTVHKTRASAQREAKAAHESWALYDRGPFRVVRYVRKGR